MKELARGRGPSERCTTTWSGAVVHVCRRPRNHTGPHRCPCGAWIEGNRTRCGIHGDDTSSGRCATCDRDGGCDTARRRHARLDGRRQP